MSREPVSSQPFSPGEKQVTPWPEASMRLEEAETYWLATVHPDCRPHVVPVLAVWMDGALYFSTALSSQKGKNLAHDSRCTITAAHPQLHLVVEGSAARVREEARLQLVAEAYATKYEWYVEVRDCAFYADGAPTAGPPPYEVHEVIPTVVFGFGTDGTFNATRWRF